MQIFNDYRLATGLWQTDVWVKDKQTVDAAFKASSSPCEVLSIKSKRKGYSYNKGTLEGWTVNARCVRL